MILTDILIDGFFAAVAESDSEQSSDPSLRSFPYIALLAARRSRLSLLFDDFGGYKHCIGFLCGGSCNRSGQHLAGGKGFILL